MQESWSAAICLDTGLTLIWWDANYKHLQLYLVQVQSIPGPYVLSRQTPVTKMKLTTPLMKTKLSIWAKLTRLMESPFNTRIAWVYQCYCIQNYHVIAILIQTLKLVGTLPRKLFIWSVRVQVWRATISRPFSAGRFKWQLRWPHYHSKHCRKANFTTGTHVVFAIWVWTELLHSFETPPKFLLRGFWSLWTTEAASTRAHDLGLHTAGDIVSIVQLSASS